MPLPREQSCTADDYWNLPEGHRAELISGQLYAMTPPGRIHQEIVSHLHAAVYNYIASKGGACKVYPAPFAVNLNADDTTYVEPDISVICDPDKLTERGCSGAPDLVIEVVSPGSRRMDYGTKMGLYMNAGVREYWIVDLAKERTVVYQFEEDEASKIIPFSHPVQAGIFPGLRVTVADLLK